MKKTQKIFYAVMIVLCILPIISSLLLQNYFAVFWIFATMIWIGVAYTLEKKYEEKIKELKDYQNGITETKN
jgi:ATP/ADP translocase